ncbi:NADH-quinone oxidoreductase subunit L [Nocardia huaxiensis]|uniref:NADH-quinone oxidoreductase subunit 5 family protein n=1 Tax=Nocardia huaxiensis TaxID=2755382 RepID=UPI001E59A698|nr:proton-conducting transporter membrane subunit [Nocardia huaxiensis]UFS99149.1 NADH-quinone oxidoreductase subunit L [Nocardia huaxiensis]
MIALPAVAGAALLLCGRRADRLAPAAAITVAAATTVLAVLNVVDRQSVSATFLHGIPVALRVDGLSAVMIVTVAAILTAVLLFAAGDLRRDEPATRFHGLMLLFAAAMLTTVTAENLLTLLFAWELMGAASYALIGFHWRDEHRAASGLVAFLTTRTADLGLYLAAAAAFAGGASALTLDHLARLDNGWRDAVAAGILLAALGKSAQLPFSFWLSRAMAGPSPVSALLHSATMVAAGAYLLLRLAPLLDATGWAAPAAAWIGALTALALGAVAVCQSDLKQLLAASTCSQVGLMVLAAGAGGVAAGTGQLVAHAVTKSLLFLGAGAWLTALGTKNLTGLRGAARAYPVVGVTFTIGALSLAGVPPFALWPAKDAVLATARDFSTALYLVGFAAAILSAVYAGRALTLVWAAATSERAAPSSSGTATSASHWDEEQAGTRRVSVAAATALAVPAIGTLAAGAGVVPAVRDGFVDIVDAGSAVATTGWELGISGAVSVCAVVLVAMVIRRRGDLPAPALPAGWFGLERVVDRCVVRPVFAIARGAAGFDDRVLDRGVRAASRLTVDSAREIDRRVERAVDGAVRGIGTAARDLGRWARRPETGLVHQYYAQAIVGIVVLAVLLLVAR